MTRAHLVPESIGGFVWARTLCPDCNSGIGTRIEAAVKVDPTIRYALEENLADELPDLARAFAEGLPYVIPSDLGPLGARFRDGADELATTRLADGSLVQERERAAETIEKMLRRARVGDADRRAALARYEAAEAGDRVDLGYGIEVRPGYTEGAQIALDGPRVPDEFPLAIGYHLLAFFLGEVIYDGSLEPIRAILRGEKEIDLEEVKVERLLSRRTGYVPRHVLGLAQGDPNVVLHVQLFGPPVWLVHLRRIQVRTLSPAALVLDVREREIYPA
jgi:hypothetical protein